MPRPTPWQDEYTLLCERCGYVIEGLDEAGACPECGRPIADSLPGHRAGTSWQQDPNLTSFFSTWWGALRHPVKLARQLRVDQSESWAPTWTALFASCLTLLPATTCLLIALSIDSTLVGNHLVAFVLYTVIGLIYCLVAGTYAMLASPRLRIIARLLGHRLLPPAARAAVCYAAFGLTLCPLLASSYFILLSVCIVLGIESDIIGIILLIWFWSAAPVALLAFEILLLIAYRSLRYHNSIAPQAQEQEA